MFENAPRQFLIASLRADLLGPRQGLHEVYPLTFDPREEYVVGSLDVDPRRLEPDELEQENGEAAVDCGDAPTGDEEEWDSATGALEWSPVCDPRREPSSMGLSWVVRGPQGGGFEVACTFAAYRRIDGQWKRTPYVFVHRFDLNRERQEVTLEPLLARLLLIRRRRGQDRFQLTLMLIHSGWEGRQLIRSERLMYQPQLRVVLDPELETVALWEFEDLHEVGEESQQRLLYRDSPVLARGHFCAAVWRAIDPEGQQVDSPWQWVDGELLPADQRERFARCHIRTEFLPVMAVQTPSTEWREKFGNGPTRSASLLSQCYEPGELKSALKPLIDGYGLWIDELAGAIDDLPQRYQPQARHNWNLCQESRLRMQAGLELLLDDEQARMAFCFANQALALQAEWKNVELVWRPFQIGFWLQCLSGLVDSNHSDRQVCDLLWFPTGGGKTEAYLAIVAFVLAERRLCGNTLDGTAVISRYTLRLLCIQQFRRALGLVTACEILRVKNWHPNCARPEAGRWGQSRFSTGLWVGSSVTPNSLQTTGFPERIPGAVDLLSGRERVRGHGEPAQVLDCPCCGANLALAEDELAQDELTLHLLVELDEQEPLPSLAQLSTHLVTTRAVQRVGNTLTFILTGTLQASLIRDWWEHVSQEWLTRPRLVAAQPTRPGYFLRKSAKGKAYDFEIYCPNPRCLLNVQTDWSENTPAGPILEPHPALAGRIPLPALTVDQQIYGRPPSLLLATVDKFARLAYEPRAATLFGNVEFFHPVAGYYRVHCLGEKDKPHPAGQKLSTPVEPLVPPELILQDELHLIDGPLGSMVGLYEAVVHHLCSRLQPPKYIASTATVREASDQVRCLFQRELRQFPAAGLSATDSFFALLPKPDPHQKSGSGRLYMGVCAPGRGPVVPLVRCWATILNAVASMPYADEVRDAYFTPVGYFNAISQLAVVGGLWRQFIFQRLQLLNPNARELNDPLELSSRIESERLPLLLKALETPLPRAAHGVLATSMFGTGVDVSRLSLMIVHGQPKTTSSYIQATGRVGRQQPGLVITALSSARPRELNHYEYFPGYHLQLYRGVEPVTVFPYAPRARERGLGPLCVALQRQKAGVEEVWRDRSLGARRMAEGLSDQALEALLSLFAVRSQGQPPVRRPNDADVRSELLQGLQRWQQLALERPNELDFEEYSMSKAPVRPVVLGDPQHLTAELPVVFRNAPQSLREVEPTTGFKV